MTTQQSQAQAPTPLAHPATDERVINSAAHMEAVTLRVGNLEQMSGYYVDALALEPLAERSQGAEVHRVLGRGDTPLVRLIHTPNLPQVDPRQAGLFHTAFLFDTPKSLAATVYRAAKHPLSRFVGSSDHSVSEAFYFTDPEGNGIELYTDRPREQWQHERGQIMMNTIWLDPNAYLQRHLTPEAVDAGATLTASVGHVHLQVGDLKTAQEFYTEAIGFETTLHEYSGALFASAGGYHHHVAMNIWNSQGAGPRAASLGLGLVEISVPTRDDLDALAARLRDRHLPFNDDGRTVTATDPWGTAVAVSLTNATTEEVLNS